MAKGINKIRLIGLLLVLLISLITYQNKLVLYVHLNFFDYQIADKTDAVSSLRRTINSAKEAGYNCKQKHLSGEYAYKEIESRRSKPFQSYPYTVTDCIQLPTGEIVLSINDGVARYYVVMEVDKINSQTYRVLDIKGEALG
jgi:hypothetical protein